MSVAIQDTPGSLRCEVVEEGARWSHSQHRLVQLVAALDESNEWELDGAPTCAHWVADALDVEVCTAREWLRVGRALAELDVVDRAFGEGRLSYSKVRALTRVATPETQAELCELAERVPAGGLGCSLAGWQMRRETPAETEARQQAAQRVHWRLDVDGMIRGGFRFAPAEGAGFVATVDANLLRQRPRLDASADASGELRPWPSISNQRAAALLSLVRNGGTAVGTEVILHVRGDGCTLDDGTPIAGSVVERLAPQSFIRALIHDAEGRPINASGRHRHPTERQQRVVRARDGACVDCGATEFLEYDHGPDFERSKRTVVDELQVRCRNCHRKRHRGEPPRE